MRLLLATILLYMRRLFYVSIIIVCVHVIVSSSRKCILVTLKLMTHDTDLSILNAYLCKFKSAYILRKRAFVLTFSIFITVANYLISTAFLSSAAYTYGYTSSFT